jgi:anti-anti-sigma factor
VGDESDFTVRVEANGAGGATAVLVLAGELDAYAAEHLTTAIDQLDPSAVGIDLDVGGVTFVDSSGLRVLLKAHDHLGASSTTTLRHPQAALLRLLELTGLLEHFRLVP